MEGNSTKRTSTSSELVMVDLSSLQPPAYESAVSRHHRPYYPTPNYAYPVEYYSSNVEPTSPPRQVVVVNQPPPATTSGKQTYLCHIFWSCFTFWLCWVFFGTLSFLLAYSARRKSTDGDQKSARSMGTASTVLTVVGIICGCAAWGVLIWWLVNPCYYYAYGVCYNARVCDIDVANTDYCKAIQSDSVYYAGCCYYFAS